ncbi:acetate--CoA ligase family protein [Aliiroseovarius sp.]|uniref:acetate--CoA ligase family protein n=1 Tax=Aliiroseovarius sp. TaxID=1872442 RepID=UPI003BAAAEA3
MSARDLSRLFRPRTIAVIGGGAWCTQVVEQCRKMGFDGAVWRVHPKGGEGVYSTLESLPSAPDAAFVGINRHATIEAVRVLRDMGAGGAVCFASGFSEAAAEDAQAHDLQADLLAAAGDMPILGPNCYGFINAIDGALLWPDQHGSTRVAKGVAILTQSSNIAINLTMQARGLPIAYTVTCGNMAQTGQAEIAAGLLDDDRVTAIGLHVEGFSDLRAWEALATKAHAKGIPLIALKVGRSTQAQAATVSHTASLAGGDAGAQALLDRLGIPRLDSLPAFLETLKLLHITGPLLSNRIASISCSGGEASLAADTAHGRDVVFPPLNATQKQALTKALGPMVALANPLDYHTYIWRNEGAMTAAWSGMVDPDLALTMIILDYPRADRCDATDWDIATHAALNVRAQTGANVAVVASLPELMSEATCERLMAGGVVPILGLDEAVMAAEAAAKWRPPVSEPVCLPGAERNGRVLSEAEAKSALVAHGLDIPKARSGSNPAELASEVSFPLVLKGEGIAHKTEAGAVALGLTNTEEVTEAAAKMPTESFLVEEMITGGVAELLIGVTRDPAHGFVLTLAAGGTLTELLQDSASLLVPASRVSIEQALSRLKMYKLLQGYRGAPAADIDAILDAVDAIQSYVLANADRLEEVEVNPLICTPTRAVAADALIKEDPA